MLQENNSPLYSVNSWHTAMAKMDTYYAYKEDDIASQKALDGDYIGADALIPEQIVINEKPKLPVLTWC